MTWDQIDNTNIFGSNTGGYRPGPAYQRTTPTYVAPNPSPQSGAGSWDYQGEMNIFGNHVQYTGALPVQIGNGIASVGSGIGGALSGVQNWIGSLGTGAKVIVLGGLALVVLSYVQKARR